MPVNVEIMVLPTGSFNALPQLLLLDGGIWRDMSPPLATRALVSVEAIHEGINDLLTEVMSQMRGGAAPAWSVLRATFRQHYQMIMPTGVHMALQRALSEGEAQGETPLLRFYIHPSTEWIPWEILHDGDNFLGLRFRIARLPITATGPDLSSTSPKQVDRAYNLLAKNVFNPSHAGQLMNGWKDTFSQLLSAGGESRFPANGNGDDFPTVDTFMSAAVDADVLHITCHGGLKDDKGRVYWTLNHQSKLTFTFHINATILNDLNLTNNPLVFGNACDSHAATGESGLTPGFGSIFFSQGALAFIGTFAPITQAMAVEFAQVFYRFLFGDSAAAPLPIAQALCEAKRHFAGQNAQDPSYLYYCLYGPGETVFQAV